MQYDIENECKWANGEYERNIVVLVSNINVYDICNRVFNVNRYENSNMIRLKNIIQDILLN